ncbi:hypothetical protein EDB81DRAFT_918007 [Dactylonectria macrodidyma]|uniref:Uncharacterized protein n=1 Tax=Dactylonectria macrodidyma TaxID=307937 RepID=A0A9P9FMC9_9HYPO|nr:hypothetical protein EDB81DRAFT_918007 [Dactylonectria macrodidyma]
MQNNRRVKFTVDPKQMALVCPNWLQIRHDARSGAVRIKNVCLDEPEAEFAIRLLFDVAHGNREARDILRTATAKELFNVAEIYEWLGRPQILRPPPTIRPDRAQCFSVLPFPFLPPEIIAKGVRNLKSKAGTMDRISEWPLLGIVAKRFGLHDVGQDVERAVALSYRGDGSNIIDQAREWFTPGQWKAFHGLGFMADERLFRYRQMYIDCMFHSLHMLVEQLMNFEAGILPNKSLFRSWKYSHVAPCNQCTTLPMDTFLRALMAEHLWPLYPKSYQGSVNDLLDALQQAGRLMGMDELGHCNQYSHLLEYLDEAVAGVAKPAALSGV